MYDYIQKLQILYCRQVGIMTVFLLVRNYKMTSYHVD